MGEIKTLNTLKKELVVSNEKIAKENGISVKSRGDQRAGRGTLTGLMRDMREKGLNEAEVNFYNQLRSENSRWAVDISMQSMMQNCHFDENDIDEIITSQREMIQSLQNEKLDITEEKRLLKVKEFELRDEIEALRNKVVKLGGSLDDEV